MCDSHADREPVFLRNLIMKIYGRWIQDTLGFYLFLGRLSQLPVAGPVVRFFAGQYGKYLHGGRAATPEECEELLRNADYIAVVDCSCRVKSNSCSKPLETCITVGRGAKIFSKARQRDFVTIDRAVQIIRESYQNGLIRSVTHCLAPEVYAICNCCTCCCVPYRLRAEFGISNAIENGASLAKIEPDRCTQCAKCVKVCPGGAINPQTGHVSPVKCLGCGLCVGACSQGAMSMVGRSSTGPPKAPGFITTLFMYLAFFAVILPLAVCYKILRILVPEG